MKLQIGSDALVIGKRVSLGGVSALIVTAVLSYFPEHAAAIRAVEGVLLFALQVWIANAIGITTGDENE